VLEEAQQLGFRNPKTGGLQTGRVGCLPCGRPARATTTVLYAAVLRAVDVISGLPRRIPSDPRFPHVRPSIQPARGRKGEQIAAPPLFDNLLLERNPLTDMILLYQRKRH
jgi:hypothetical protein